MSQPCQQEEDARYSEIDAKVEENNPIVTSKLEVQSEIYEEPDDPSHLYLWINPS